MVIGPAVPVATSTICSVSGREEAGKKICEWVLVVGKGVKAAWEWWNANAGSIGAVAGFGWPAAKVAKDFQRPLDFAVTTGVCCCRLFFCQRLLLHRLEFLL